MRVNIAIPEAHVTKPVLDAALESVTRLNEQLIQNGAPTAKQLIEQGAQWKPEPPGQEHFDHAGILAQRGHGDCDDWAPLHAASLRKTGEDPGAKAVVHRSGPHTWHAVVERSNGKIDDPSKAAGMGTNGHGVHGAVLPLMSQPGAVVGGVYVVRPNLAIRPSPRGYQARVDLPWHWREHLQDPLTPTDYAMTALHSAPVANMALTGAIEGAIELAQAAGFADPEHIERLAAICEAAEGCPEHDLVQRWGPQHAAAATQLVGSFFGDVFKAAVSPLTAAAHFVQHPSLSNLTHIVTDPITSHMHAMSPIAHMAAPLMNMARPFASFIPGIGPAAMTAFDMLQHGPPTSFGDFAHMAMQAAPNFIPGGSFLQNIPGMGGGGGFLQQAMHAIPGMGGSSPMQMPFPGGGGMPMQMPFPGMPGAGGGGFPWPRAFQ